MQTTCGPVPEAVLPPLDHCLAPADEYWRKVLTGQRLLARAAEQQRVCQAQLEALRDRRRAMRQSLAAVQETVERLQLETQEPPLKPEEKEALRILIEGVIRYHRRAAAAKAEERETADAN